MDLDICQVILDIMDCFGQRCHAKRLLHTKQARGMTTTNSILANRVCELAAGSDSVHQADNRLPAMRWRSL